MRRTIEEAYEVIREHGGSVSPTKCNRLRAHRQSILGLPELRVVPDIVTMAKSLGNGVPIAAVTSGWRLRRPSASVRIS